jgi:CcmD family protein
METLLAAFAVAWAVVSAFVLRIAVGNVGLARRLDRLETFLGEQHDGQTSRSKVA